MPVIPKRYNIEINEILLNPIESSPLAHGFSLASESQSYSQSQSPDLASTWDNHENTNPVDTDEDHELHQLMEDVKRYIRSIDISNL